MYNLEVLVLMITRIMVAEDNTSVFSCYQKFFSKDESIKFIEHAQDGETTIKMYKEKNPDLLFLDLNLPKKNGLEILNEITNYESENIKCNVVVISGDAKLRHNLYNTRKVYRIIPKPASLELIETTIKNFRKEQELDSFSESKCNDLLMKLKLNPYSKNGRMLMQIIKLCYCDLELLDNMKQIYSILGHKYSCSPEKIKSSLRSIIRTANNYSNYTILNTIFYCENNTININVSPKHFINGIVLYLKKRT